MRMMILMVLALGLAGVLALFPSVANQPLKVEAFGWLFETRQGAFILALLLLLGVAWGVQRVISALFAGPGQIWQAIRSGSHKRREARLRDGLAQWIDQRGDLGVKNLKKSSGLLPEWMDAMLVRMGTPADQQILPEASDEDTLLTAMTARIVTHPAADPTPDVATRQAHLDAWLRVHPSAPLALQRRIDLAEETEDWHTLDRLLERIWQKSGQPAAAIRFRLASVCLKLAEINPEHALEYLRKAQRLDPNSSPIILALGQEQIEQGEVDACRKLWEAYLADHDDFIIAEALYHLQRNENPLKCYRKMEKIDIEKLSPSRRWLRAELAHAAQLQGLAEEHMQALIQSHPSPKAWQSLGAWYAEAENWKEAVHCYQQALVTTQLIP